MTHLLRVAATVIALTMAVACSSTPTSTTSSPATSTGTALGAGAEVGRYAWTQLGEGTRVEVRALADGACPDATIDGKAVPMTTFMPATAAFPHTTCAVEVPPDARRVSVGSHRLPPPPDKLDRIAVVGDIGCYLKTKKQQDCLNGFPAQQIAARIAAQKPDLVVFVGDIYYSQDECEEASKCAGVPVGDAWDTWAYDFFDPYRSALDTAPWIFARGNHESCDTKDDNGGPGWFQILAPEPSPCTNYTEPYRVDLYDQSFIVFDSALADDQPANEAQVPEYAANFAKVHELAKERANNWFVDHRPLWAATGTGSTDTMNATLEAAIARSGNTLGTDVSLILSGHVHALGAFTMADGRPAQIVSGGGGTELDTSKAGTYSGRPIDGTTFAYGELEADWGYVRLDRTVNGWDATYEQYQQDPKGGGDPWSTWMTCSFAARALSCPS